MEKTFQLEIMTPEKQFFKGQAEGLIMPALDGEYGVQPGHEPIVTALEPGTCLLYTSPSPRDCS